MIEISRENLIDQIRKLAKVKCAPIIGIDGMAERVLWRKSWLHS